MIWQKLLLLAFSVLFMALFGELALLHEAVLRLALDHMVGKGFVAAFGAVNAELVLIETTTNYREYRAKIDRPKIAPTRIHPCEPEHGIDHLLDSPGR